MKVEHLLQYLKDNGKKLRETILKGKYWPNPVRSIEISKETGKKRKLGIPIAVDRVIQQQSCKYYHQCLNRSLVKQAMDSDLKEVR